MDDETRRVLRRIARLLSEAQRERGFSTADLARRSGVAGIVIERLTRAEGDPGVEVIYRLAGALDVPPSKLIGGIEWVPDEMPDGHWRISGEERA